MGAAAGTGLAIMAGAVAVAGLWLWFWWWAVDAGNPVLAPVAVLLMTAILAWLTYLAPPGRDGLLLAALAAGAAFEARRAVPVVVAIAVPARALQGSHGAHLLTALGGAVDHLLVWAAGIGGRRLRLCHPGL